VDALALGGMDDFEIPALRTGAFHLGSAGHCACTPRGRSHGALVCDPLRLVPPPYFVTLQLTRLK
jgi:hypothetical protein